MCKVGIIFDDSLNTATNVPFIDTIANILRDSKDKEELIEKLNATKKL